MKASASETALTDFPRLREEIEMWKATLAQTDWIPWLIVGLAAALRLFLLGIKPPHFDEGINGWFVDQMVKNGFYRYDPTNYHGPLHFYVLFVWLKLFGRNLWALRLPIVLISTASVWLTLKFEPFVGRTVARWAALAMAVSPGFVFYGRYSIHEAWLVFFSMLFILGALGLWRYATRRFLWLAGLGAIGMILTKETYVIHVACAVLAVPVCYISHWLAPAADVEGDVPRPNFRLGAKPLLRSFSLALIVHLVSAVCLLSAPFVSMKGHDYVVLIAAVGLISAFFVPMQFEYGKPNERQTVSVLSAQWSLWFFFSVCGQIAFFLPKPWCVWFWMLAVVGIFSAFYIRADHVFVVRYDVIDLFAVVLVGAAVIVFFYSGTYFHWNGVRGLVQAYSAWFATGTEGHGHEKPPDYWLRLMGRYEFAACLGLVSCLFCQRLKNIHLRYLAIYAVGTLAAYSIVKYKTPWCIVSIIWPLLFLFGAALTLAPLRLRALTYQLGGAGLLVCLGVAIWFATHQDYTFLWPFLLMGVLAVMVIAQRDRRETQMLLTIVLCVSLGAAVWLNYFRCTTETEPYVYVQTYNDVFKLTEPVLALARRDPANYDMTGHLIRSSSYPLPWMLGDFSRVGYYEHESLPPKLDADFLLVQSDRIQEIEQKLQNSYYTEPLTIRPYQDTSKVYFEAKRFKDLFPGRIPDFVGHGPR